MSETAVRDPCRFVEVIVTVTPGIGEPPVVTVPVRLAVVCAAAGSAKSNNMLRTRFQLIVPPAPCPCNQRPPETDCSQPGKTRICRRLGVHVCVSSCLYRFGSPD